MSTGANRRLGLYHKIASAGEAAVSYITAAVLTVGAVTAMRSTRDGYGVVPLRTGATFTASAAQDIGPIGRPSTTLEVPAVGALVYAGAKTDDWTSVADLTGDNLTWTTYVSYATTTGSDCGLVVAGTTFTSVPSYTNKTFTVTGGAAADTVGKSLLIAEAALPRTNTRRLSRPLALGISRPISRPLAA